MSDFVATMRERISRLTGSRAGCTHLDQAHDVQPRTTGCEECLAAGMRWVHLRLCLSCGHVGCCNQSEGKHAFGHFEETGHPIIRSHEPGEVWGWCWVDEIEV
jgi:uncharacterized UBP type Zn finger protein